MTREPQRKVVVHVVLQARVGGMEKLLVEFAKHADDARFDVRFVCLGPWGPIADELASRGSAVVALAEPDGLRPGLVLRLCLLLRRWRADVVHAHNTKPLLYAAPAARMAGVRRVVYTRHGQRFGARRRETTALRLACRLVDFVVCVSEDGARLCDAEGVERGKISTIPNGVDLDRFRASGPRPGGPLVMVGRLSREKGVENLIAAFGIASREAPGLRLLVAGGGPRAAELQGLVARLGLAGSIRLLGEVRDVRRVLRRGSVFVLPSLTEGISLTLLEAMATGLPVVATRVGGTPEVVLDGVTGLLVPPGSPEALAAAIIRLHGDPELGGQMGLAGLERVRGDFDVTRMVFAYEALYEASAGGPRVGGDRPAAGPSPSAAPDPVERGACR